MHIKLAGISIWEQYQDPTLQFPYGQICVMKGIQIECHVNEIIILVCSYSPILWYILLKLIQW